MKKILFTLFMIGALVSSCDMDKKPYGSLDDSSAIQSLNDCFRFRNSLYSNMRSVTTGAYVYTSDIQMDLFQGVISNGNRNGMFANGNIVSSDQDIEAMWGNLYHYINAANYLLEKAEMLSANAEFDDEQRAELNRYIGEAKFARAFYYYWLLDHFCDSYTNSGAQGPAKGLPLVTVYNPTGDMSKYPGRSTQDETYALIENDLKDAYEALVAYETIDDEAVVPNASYLSSYAVLALQARLALLKGDNTTALSKAKEVINSTVY